MERLTTRRFLKCLAAPLIVAQVGCAARGVHVAPAPTPPSVSEEERKACAEFAKREAKSVSTRSVADAAGEGFAAGLLGGFYSSTRAWDCSWLRRLRLAAPSTNP
jgi:hypothetical protein